VVVAPRGDAVTLIGYVPGVVGGLTFIFIVDEHVGPQGLLLIDVTEVWAGRPLTLRVTRVVVPEVKVLVTITFPEFPPGIVMLPPTVLFDKL